MVQNHLLQLIGLFAAEPPSVADADGLRDKRAEVFRAMPSADPAHYVRGQYDGYRSVKGVQPDSQTETFAALRLEIDNWRWSGVPFFMRAGKELRCGPPRSESSSSARPSWRSHRTRRIPTSSSCASIPAPVPIWWSK